MVRVNFGYGAVPCTFIDTYYEKLITESFSRYANDSITYRLMCRVLDANGNERHMPAEYVTVD